MVSPGRTALILLRAQLSRPSESTPSSMDLVTFHMQVQAGPECGFWIALAPALPWVEAVLCPIPGPPRPQGSGQVWPHSGCPWGVVTSDRVHCHAIATRKAA